MQGLLRVPLEDGGTILFEAVPTTPAGSSGPVKAGRIADGIRELPRTLQESLVPVRDTARAVLEQLREAGPDEVEVEFGVNLATEAGAVITKTGAGVHLKVRVLWQNRGTDVGTSG
ncbi:CU044_2847 family protein [Streptomyces sp. NPDC093591]|uniref:CU044_2847 family protein n=1 Tax=Streptomyces sp. NPDC093591 TaxID=3366044 RepID=UPI003814F552